MKLDEKTITEIEKKEKLNWVEKIAVKKMIKKAKKIIKEYKQKVIIEAEEREKIEKEVLSMTDILEIETDKGEELNKQNIKELTNEELEETLELSLKEMEKLL